MVSSHKVLQVQATLELSSVVKSLMCYGKRWCDIAAVVHVLQMLVFGQQSEYASCNTSPFLNSLKL